MSSFPYFKRVYAKHSKIDSITPIVYNRVMSKDRDKLLLSSPPEVVLSPDTPLDYESARQRAREILSMGQDNTFEPNELDLDALTAQLKDSSWVLMFDTIDTKRQIVAAVFYENIRTIDEQPAWWWINSAYTHPDRERLPMIATLIALIGHRHPTHYIIVTEPDQELLDALTISGFSQGVDLDTFAPIYNQLVRRHADAGLSRNEPVPSITAIREPKLTLDSDATNT